MTERISGGGKFCTEEFYVFYFAKRCIAELTPAKDHAPGRIKKNVT